MPRTAARWPLPALVAGLAVLAWFLVDYDLSVLLDPVERERAWQRVGAFLSGFGAPELSGDYLRRCADLTYTTLAMAIAGTMLGIAGGFVLAALASTNVLVAEARGLHRGLLRAVVELARLVQDVLRGVPDFAWALLLVPTFGLGTNSGAGVLALALNVTGILARVYSELFDAVPARSLEPLRAAGASRLQSWLFGILPQARPGLLSFTLLRWECAVRNASVLGIVGAGGLGSELQLRIEYGEGGKVLTVLFFLLALTAGSDLLSQFVRERVHHEEAPAARRQLPWSIARQRRRQLGLLAALVVLFGWAAGETLPASLGRAPNMTELGDRLQATADLFGGLLQPDLSLLPHALASAVVPLSMAWLGTLFAAVLAGLFAFFGSQTLMRAAATFTGERVRAPARIAGRLAWGGTKALAILLRAVPDLVWAMLLMNFLRQGPLPGMLAILLHTLGLLLRLYAENVDATPLRRLEVVHATAGTRARTYLWGVVPASLGEWTTQAFLQFEANVRTGVVLGFVGAGGLGLQFQWNLGMFRLDRAAAYLIVMILLAVVLDRISRLLGMARTRLIV